MEEEKIRINKFIALCGITSRRKAEALIKNGKVTVNGKIVTDLSYKVDPKKDIVLVEGKRLTLPQKVYYLFYKPKGFLTSLYDPFSRETIKPFIEKLPVRVFPVGRLDKQSEGLLLLTNDGDLANILLHPRYEVRRKYLVWVKPELNSMKIKEILERGLVIEGKPIKPLEFKLVGKEKDLWIYEVCVKEGIKREVRRMVGYLGGKVYKLVRTQFGPLKLGALKPGEIRPLSSKELKDLFSFVTHVKNSKTFSSTSSGEET